MGTCASKPSCGGVDDVGTQGRDVRYEPDSLSYLPTKPEYILEDTTKSMKIKIKPRSRTAKQENNKSYPLIRRGKGTVFIINNAEEDSKKGAVVDVKNISQLFKTIKYKVKIVSNFKKNEMVKSLESFAKNCKAEETDLCVIVIIGNVKCTAEGNKLVEIAGSDNNFILTSDIIDYFSDEKCPQLKGKPKVFLLHGHYYDKSAACHQDYSMKLMLKDMFIANAVLTGKMQKQALASYYIQAFCRVVMENVYDTDLQSIIQKVEQIVYQHEKGTQSTHYDNLYFEKCYLYN